MNILLFDYIYYTTLITMSNNQYNNKEKWYCCESRELSAHVLDEKVSGDTAKFPGEAYYNCKKTNATGKRCDFFAWKNKPAAKAKPQAAPASNTATNQDHPAKRARTEGGSGDISQHNQGGSVDVGATTNAQTYGPSESQLRFQSIEKELADLKQQVSVLMGVMQLKLVQPENKSVAQPAAAVDAAKPNQ